MKISLVPVQGGLSFYAEPQHHHATAMSTATSTATASRLAGTRRQLGASTMPKAPFASSMSNSSELKHRIDRSGSPITDRPIASSFHGL